MEQCPQLLHRVLDRSAGEEQSVATVEAQQHSPSHTVCMDTLTYDQGRINPQEGKRACNVVYSKIQNATKNSNNCKPEHY